jgi:protein phosphatase
MLINSLKSAIMVANSAILEYAKVDSIETIGTTLTIAMVYNGHLFIAHVGDSRVYKIDKAKKAIQLTQDHSLPEVLFRNGDIAIEDKKNYKKNILLYVVGTENLKKENIDVFYHGKLKRDDTIFLCSDGVWDIDGVEDRLLDNAEDLKRYILNSTPSDNASFIRYRYKGN